MATKRMNYGFSSEVGYACFLGSCVVPETSNNVVNGDPSTKLFCVFSEMNPKKPSFVSFTQVMLVLVVFGSRCFSEIVKSVIRSVSVFMIYVTTWKAPLDIKKSKSLRPIGLSIKSDRDVSATMKVTGYTPSSNSERSSYFPVEQPSIRTIVQNFAQSFSGKLCRIFSSHDAPPVRWDQRRGRVSSACLALSC